MTAASQIMQNVFGASIFRKLLNQYRENMIISKIYQPYYHSMHIINFSDDLMKVDENLIVWEKNTEAYL